MIERAQKISRKQKKERKNRMLKVRGTKKDKAAVAAKKVREAVIFSTGIFLSNTLESYHVLYVYRQSQLQVTGNFINIFRRLAEILHLEI